jgi:hypothetical protein
MDELEWLKRNSPSAEPSRDTTRRHRTQLRSAIATEGIDGTRPQRPSRRRRSRHRVLIAGAAVVGLCAAGAAVVALTTSWGGGGNEVAVPIAGSATTGTPAACTGPPPGELQVPSGFGNPTAAPARQAATPPTNGQQVTSWTSDTATIEQRWPADREVMAQIGSPDAPDEGVTSVADKHAVDDKAGFHRTAVFLFAEQAAGCADLQVTVYAGDAATVDGIVDELLRAPFVSHEPLVTTTGVATTAPPVVACDGVARVPAAATVGGSVSQASFAQSTDALTEFLAGRATLAARGYEELRLDDGSVAYVKRVQGNVVTTVHVVSGGNGWTVEDWQASGC